MVLIAPILQERLHGEGLDEKKKGKERGLCCGNYTTSLESITQWGPPLLGCTECYAIFGNFLVGKLTSSDAISLSQEKTLYKTISSHPYWKVS